MIADYLLLSCLVVGIIVLTLVWVHDDHSDHWDGYV